METVHLTTADDVILVGDLYAAGDGPVALLLHMMPSDRTSWRAFAPMLLERGFGAVLAIDERGHGESVRRGDGTVLDHRAFSDEEQQAKMKDVTAAVAFLRARARSAPLVLVGASIGANLSLVYAAAHSDVRAVAALSPGLDYRGVVTSPSADGLDGRRVLLAASVEDERSAAAVRELSARISGVTQRLLDGAGHGTAMFERAPGFIDEVADWVAAAVLDRSA